jgi:3-dehydroquinate dehydratase II
MPSPRTIRPPSASVRRGRRNSGRRPLRILFVNGPNLNVLGKREPDRYGKRTLQEIQALVVKAAGDEGAAVEFFQSNHEGEIVECLQGAAERADGIVINPAGLTHTSVAIRDALIYSGLPAVEVHLSNTASREPFRRNSLIEDTVVGRVSGFGGYGYLLSLFGILDHLRGKTVRGGS